MRPHRSVGYEAPQERRLSVTYAHQTGVIVEATGGIAPHTRAHMRYLARRSRGKGATDRTRYGTTRISTKSFYTHHGQMLVKAAVVYDALAINKHIVNQRQKLYHERTNGAAHAAVPGEVGA